ncbi:SDR family NAD(P)-dependent oxidoreductase [Agrilactobacillus yilanensis]|uniref:SDR family NAD(P)-dependent oxidoreductase n=1 Tax=Agrilactobacillus yilanensis TaxID=2485997 RepID=A0ABW4J614_9LACO|nr:SDR family NAD(P)-dependent oxidoreductase [Agrilactobacillus yilanensis]
MHKKIILISGATDGIGKETALELAKQGHQIVIHGRNKTKAAAVVKELKLSSGNQTIQYLIADLFSMKAIQNMVVAFNLKFDHLDVLINNAGAVFDNQRATTRDGIEKTMALNVMAPFLLSQLLLPALQKSDDGRIINLSSAAHRMSGKPDVNDFNLTKVSSAQRRYGLSKRFLIWNTQTMAQQLLTEGIKNVTVNAAHPGMIATNFGQSSDKGFLNNLIYKSAISLAKIPPIGRQFSVQHGAATDVYLASDPKLIGITGKFFGNSQEQHPATDKDSDTDKQKLWKYCEQITAPYTDVVQPDQTAIAGEN